MFMPITTDIRPALIKTTFLISVLIFLCRNRPINDPIITVIQLIIVAIMTVTIAKGNKLVKNS